MKRIVLVGNTAWSMVKFRMELMRRLVAEGYDLYVLAPSDTHSDEIRETGAKYIEITIDNQGANPIKDAHLIMQLCRHYRRIDPDLIFHYTIKPNIYGSFAAKITGKTSIAVVTGLGYTFINDSISARIAKKLYRISFRYPFQIWFVNRHDLNHFLHEKLIRISKAKLLPGEGIDTKKFTPIPKPSRQPYRFALIARLLWDKGVGEYVEASRMLKTRYDDVVCDLVGFTDAKNPQAIPKSQIDAWHAAGDINYLGVLHDVRAYIASCDTIVLPSYREGLSMILMEAASMARPIIATAVPGCSDLVIDGETGLLCRPRDAEDLFAKMEQLYLMPQERRTQMGMRTRRHMIEHHEASIVVDRYLETIETLLGSTDA